MSERYGSCRNSRCPSFGKVLPIKHGTMMVCGYCGEHSPVQTREEEEEERWTKFYEELNRVESPQKKIRGYQQELRDTEAELAEALGYTYDDDYGWATGDHTTVTLAMEAKERIAELEGALEGLRMILAPLLMGGTSEPSREFDEDIKRMAVEEIDKALAQEGGGE